MDRRARNIDPGVGELYNVYVYNRNDLTEIVQQNRNARESEVPGSGHRRRSM